VDLHRKPGYASQWDFIVHLKTSKKWGDRAFGVSRLLPKLKLRRSAH